MHQETVQAEKKTDRTGRVWKKRKEDPDLMVMWDSKAVGEGS